MTSDSTILAAAHRLVRRNGAISVEQLGSEVTAQAPDSIANGDVRGALESHSRTRWLDSERIWFWFGGRGGNRVLHIIEKIMAIARSIEIPSLCEGVRRVPGLHDWAVPHEIVGRLCEESSLCHREGSKLTATTVVRDWRVLLGRTELAVVEILHAHGPALARHELERHAAEHPHLDPDGLDAHLTHSPMLEQVDAHVFRLRGLNGSAASAKGTSENGAKPLSDPKRTAASWQATIKRPPQSATRRKGTHTILPRGRHGLPREAVAENQRTRLLDGIVAVVAERGYAEATIADAVAIAHVSRKTFYELFTDKEACFAAACERWLGNLMGETRAAFESSPQETWCERAQLALAALLRQVSADPIAARAFLVEATGAGAGALARRDAAIRELAELVDLGREAGSQQPPGITSQVMIGGLEELIRSRILHGATAQLPNLLPDLLFCLVQPLLGTEAATKHRDRARRRLDQGAESPAPA